MTARAMVLATAVAELIRTGHARRDRADLPIYAALVADLRLRRPKSVSPLTSRPR